MKTIAELKSKMWFRAIKVIYVLFVVFLYGVALCAIAMAFVTIKDNKKEFVRVQKENTEKSELIEELKLDGYTTIQITNTLKDKYNPYGTLQLTREQVRAIYGEEEHQKLNNTETKQPKPEEPGTMKWLLLIIPGSIFLAWLISQIVKWIFYYIVLGAIRPPEKNESHHSS